MRMPMSHFACHTRWAILVAAGAIFLSACSCSAVSGSNPAGKEEGAASIPARGWRGTAIDLGASMALAAEKGTIFYGFDQIVGPDKAVELTARVLSVRKQSAVKDVTVEFRLGSEKIGTAKTDPDGLAKLKWKPPKIGDYSLKVAIVDVPNKDFADMKEITPAPLVVVVRDKKSRVIVIDLDHTVVDASFFSVLFGTPRAMAGSAGVIKELHKKGDCIVFLTHRPDLLASKSKSWLRKKGFIEAPLLVSSLKDLADSGKFKAERIKALRKDFPNTSIGIGDKFSDAEAYIDNGMTAYLIPDYDRRDDDEDDLRKLAKKVRKLDRRTQVVDTWQEVRDGILSGKKFPPAAYADRLEARADAIRQAERKKDDDDDD